LRAKAAELAKSAQAGVMVNNKIILQAKMSKPVPSAKKTSHG